MPEKIAFTADRITRLKPPADGRKYVYDSKTPGLAVCCSSTGRKVYYYYRWQNGRPARIRLGKHPDLSVQQARDAAAEEAGKQARGVDLVAERRRQRQETTLEELFKQWLEVHAKPRKRTWRDDERQFKKYLSPLRNRRISALRPAEISKWHASIGTESGPVQANRCKALLATLLNYAVRLEMLTANPCRSVPNFPELSRERFLLPSEMKQFFDAMVAVGEPWHDFFQLCLFTGARRGNVASMAWQEIDFDRMTWTIPGSKTKNKRPVVIALPPPAVAILTNRLAWTAGTPWVFPANSASGHLVDPRKAWERVRTTSGLTDLRMHDLRRSLGSWQATAGASLAVIGASLGHADLKSTQVYARLQLDPVRAAVDQATTAMLQAGGMLTLDVETKGGNDEK
ncbi:MAG: tyrosine-type recombinase/integrase [Pirellulaceae bacterium]|nr:tyrosine-type recombinase/integrase [Pirellulaceae bacterium]